MSPPLDHDRSRLSVAQEAARIMADHGIQDFHAAKRKAAERLGLDQFGTLPSNVEVEAALIEHRRIYDDDHGETLATQRRLALEVMNEMADFEPRLVGPVLAGTAAPDAPANLHLFADSAEDVSWFLMDRAIEHRSFERRLRMRRGASTSFPGYRFDWQSITVEATVFSYDGLRQAPLSPVDGKPMRRASIKKVKKLVAGPDGPTPID